MLEGHVLFYVVGIHIIMLICASFYKNLRQDHAVFLSISYEKRKKLGPLKKSRQQYPRCGTLRYVTRYWHSPIGNSKHEIRNPKRYKELIRILQ